MINENTRKLVELYSSKSKHSNYQVLPTALKDVLEPGEIQTKTRSEKERLDYVLSRVNLNDKFVLDIGANTGFFSFEALEAGALHVDYCEGNKEHSEFVQTAIDTLGVKEKLKVINKYFDFDKLTDKQYDVVLLFNVLHHVGDDYGSKDLTVAAAKDLIVQHLNNMAKITDTLVFQLGFNWQGKVDQPLFEHGTKAEMIDFVEQGIKDVWEVQSIGIAQRQGSDIVYEDLDDNNIERDDSLGEFLNRPIFILQSKASNNG